MCYLNILKIKFSRVCRIIEGGSCENKNSRKNSHPRDTINHFRQVSFIHYLQQSIYGWYIIWSVSSKNECLSTRGLITTSYFGRAAIASSITIDRAKESCKMVLEGNSREVHNGNGEYVENDSSRMRNAKLWGGSWGFGYILPGTFSPSMRFEFATSG